ncbi:MAG TPA: UDP-N-acetylglucosamine 2-epimerase (non-hydrolyzing) [Chryseosolibacter sp.]|nr:UDP-N-acetylglucosamine 2-epimerase (non-hydrolyzing) [Chryseosolibacter sp.]
MRILTVFGTRPEAIKMAPLVLALNKDDYFDHKVCVTGQHRQLLDQVLEIFEIVPDFDLNLMVRNQTLHSLTAEILIQVKEVLDEFKPAFVLVHGDTTTSFATSLACFYSGIKVCHVEAGLRTGNISSPFPEEANRLLTARLTEYHFAPTERNVTALLNEGISKNKIIKTGNTVIDALFWVVDHGKENAKEISKSEVFNLLDGSRKILLVTGHRRESFGQGFIEICDALAALAKQHPELEIIYPVHLNPKVRDTIFERISGIQNIHLIEPVSYLTFIFLMKSAYLILTDSGGVQEEGPSLGKPVLVMRDATERPEAVEAGTVKLVGANKMNIISGVNELLENRTLYNEMSHAINPYGDGHASERIVSFLKSIQ